MNPVITDKDLDSLSNRDLEALHRKTAEKLASRRVNAAQQIVQDTQRRLRRFGVDLKIPDIRGMVSTEPKQKQKVKRAQSVTARARPATGPATPVAQERSPASQHTSPNGGGDVGRITRRSPVPRTGAEGEKEFRWFEQRCRRRGISLELSFEEWMSWWKADNRWERRKSEGLVMTQFDLAAPLSNTNVRCITKAKLMEELHRSAARAEVHQASPELDLSSHDNGRDSGIAAIVEQFVGSS